MARVFIQAAAAPAAPAKNTLQGFTGVGNRDFLKPISLKQQTQTTIQEMWLKIKALEQLLPDSDLKEMKVFKDSFYNLQMRIDQNEDIMHQ